MAFLYFHECKKGGKFKHQKTNHKWFDKLTTLSQVEGQIPMTQIQTSKLTIHNHRCQLA